MLAEDSVSDSKAGSNYNAKNEQKRSFVKNNLVRNAFAILQAFRNSEDWLTSRELSQRACLPKSSGHRLIVTLEELGAVIRGPNGRYRPGMLLVSLSHTVMIADLLKEVSQEVMQNLASKLQLTVHLGVLDDGMVTYVNKVSTPNAFPPYTRVGSKLEAYCSGLGKILLAALPPHQLENFILEGELVALTPYTITDRTLLRAELVRIRALGYAVDDREYQANMRCIAVPVQDVDGRVIAALSATGETEKLSDEQHEKIRDELLVAAAMIARKLNPVRAV